MNRLVRVVEVVDGDAPVGPDELLRRAAALPAAIAAHVVTTGAGTVVTLTRSYRPTPGSRSRAVRSLQRALRDLVGT